jgi:hypothetical protein
MQTIIPARLQLREMALISPFCCDAIGAQREGLAALRREGKISEDAFQRLEEKLDWAELEVLDA